MQRSLLGILVDVSGSMTSSIKSQSGSSQSRLEGFRDSLAQLAERAATMAYGQRDATLELFAYGFGFDNPVTTLLGIRTGPPVRDLLAVEEPSGLTDVKKLAREWATYQRYIQRLVPAMFGTTPMRSAFDTARGNFSIYGAERFADRILLVVSDGEPTDATPSKVAEVAHALKRDGVLIVSCYVTDTDLTEPRRLYTTPEAHWPEGARLMHECASPAPPGSPFAQYLKELGWRFDEKAHLFTQVNQSELLAEFMNVVISPLGFAQSSEPEPAVPPPVISRAPEFQKLTDFAKKKQIVQGIELSISNPGGLRLDDEQRLKCAASPYDLDRITLYLAEEHDTTAPHYKMRLTRVQHEIERIQAAGFEGSLMPLSYALGSFLAALRSRPHLVANAHTDVRVFWEFRDDLAKYPHLDSGQHVKRDLDAIIEIAEPAGTKASTGPAPPTTATPTPVPAWVQIAGYCTGLLTLIFFMYLALFGNGQPNFASIVVLALGAALAFSFLGGKAAAEGKLPMFKDSPLTFSVAGGVAVLIIALILGRFLFLGEVQAANPDEYSFSIGVPVSLEVVVGELERDKNITVFYARCPAEFPKTMVAAGSHTGTTPKAFLERLQDRLKDSTVKYNVSVSPQGQGYEIACL